MSCVQHDFKKEREKTKKKTSFVLREILLFVWIIDAREGRDRDKYLVGLSVNRLVCFSITVKSPFQLWRVTNDHHTDPPVTDQFWLSLYIRCSAGSFIALHYKDHTKSRLASLV